MGRCLQVAAVPAPDELVAERFPALPRNSPDAVHHLPLHSIERLLDTHFRQLRHEAVYPLSQAARKLVAHSAEVLALVRHRGSCKLDLQRLLGLEEDSMPLFAFGAGSYVGADLDSVTGVVHRFQTDEVQEMQVQTTMIMA